MPGHESVFLYSGRLDPQPAATAATLTESDGSVVPVVWRRLDDTDESLPLYPAEAVPWIRRLADADLSSSLRTAVFDAVFDVGRSRLRC